MRRAFCLVMLLVSGLAHPLGYGEGKLEQGPAWADFHISGFSENPVRVVSGTNVSFGIHIDDSGNPDPGPHEAEYWRFDEVTSVALTIGGQNVELFQPTPMNWGIWSKTIVFMSNHFEHDSTQPVTMTVTGRFELVSHPSQAVISTTSVTSQATVSFKVYNDLLSWHTTVAAFNEPFVLQRDYPPVSLDGVLSARALLAEAKHDIPDPLTLTKAEIHTNPDARLHEATGVFGFTHGNNLSVQDSGVGIITHLEYGSKVGTRAAGHPGMNFGIFYACYMYSIAAPWHQAHFGTTAVIDNKFFAGFEDLVYSILKPDSRDHNPLVVKVDQASEELSADLSDHADMFISLLTAGATAEGALLAANTSFPPRGTPTIDLQNETASFPLLDMKRYGHPLSTIGKVYRYHAVRAASEQGEPIADTYSDWYITGMIQ